jgi:photosystem II stability/assembly factor-like uncharacterized protein
MRCMLWIPIAAALTVSPAGAQWLATAGPGRAGITTFLTNGTTLLAGTTTAGVYRSDDGGADWTAANNSMEHAAIASLAGSDGYLYAGLAPGAAGPGVFRSADAGVTWTPAGLDGHGVISLFASGALALAGTVGSGVFRSTDHGTSWAQSNDNIGNQSIGAIVAVGGVIYASGDNNLYRSTDGGLTWDFTDGGQYYGVFSMLVTGQTIYAGGFGGLLRSTDGGASFEGPIWIDILPGLQRITSFAVRGNDLYASTAGGPGCGVIRSRDGGTSWEFANGSIANASLAALTTAGGDILAGGLARGLLHSTDEGAHWTSLGQGLPPGTNIRFLLPAAGGVVAGTGGDGLYRTANAGATWSSISADASGLLQNEIVGGLVADGPALLATGAADGVFRSTDGGATWALSNAGLPVSPGFFVQAIGRAGPDVTLGTSDGIFVSSDHGLNWAATNVTFGTSGFAAEPGLAYAVVNSGVYTTTGVYRSTNAGLTWSLAFPTMQITPSAIAAGDGFVYLGDLSSGLFRSSDHGVTWSGTSFTGATFAILPIGPTVYVGSNNTSGAMFRSTDHGATWSAFNGGLPADAAIEALAADGPFLYAGDDQRGVWRATISPAGLNPATQEAAIQISEPRPNPFDSGTRVEATFGIDGPIEVAVYDAQGRHVRTVFSGLLRAGTYSWWVSRDRLSAGTYYLRIDDGRGATAARQMNVLGR